jgi:hypothetical protein
MYKYLCIWMITALSAMGTIVKDDYKKVDPLVDRSHKFYYILLSPLCVEESQSCSAQCKDFSAIYIDKISTVTVDYDLAIEKANQRSVDEGHSPWRLDPVFVAQVFVSLKISPQGIVGEYPVKSGDLKVKKVTESEAIIEVNTSLSPIKNVYLKRLIRKCPTGIWTVVAYDTLE